MRRGEIWWANLQEPSGSAPGFRRPVVIVSADIFDSSAIRTVAVATMASNLARTQSLGNILIPSDASGLPRDSVINVTQIAAIDNSELDEFVGELRGQHRDRLEAGLRIVLDLA